MAQLEANMVAAGCRGALIVWLGILIDGHNRLVVCHKHNLFYSNRIYSSYAGKAQCIPPLVRHKLGLTRMPKTGCVSLSRPTAILSAASSLPYLRAALLGFWGAVMLITALNQLRNLLAPSPS
jgi:hypothetical protein